ncbi:hypothetical protein E2C01_024030 [Portunus trituberculatus]|uniref:Uncharacterized protein n=1 Tax=Portunus trituberculatus TaxID=210409 RepID=A0A5B7E9E5_PORTR|nr:hypothetical protein [Portunus trituberculatus]
MVAVPAARLAHLIKYVLVKEACASAKVVTVQQDIGRAYSVEAAVPMSVNVVFQTRVLMRTPPVPLMHMVQYALVETDVGIKGYNICQMTPVSHLGRCAARRAFPTRHVLVKEDTVSMQMNVCWNATCLTNPNPVVFGSNCRDIGDYKFDSDCRTKCCKKCKPDAQCCSEGGRCYIDNCPVDLQQSQTGTCNDDANCKCCV